MAKLLTKLCPGCDVLNGWGQDELLLGQGRNRSLLGRDPRPEAHLPEDRRRSEKLQTR